MGEQKNLITLEGKLKLEKELEYLENTWRKEIAAKINEAREQGDLSENAEYDAAMDEQRDQEARITKLKEILKYAEVIEIDADDDKASVGCKVRFLDVEFDEELEYQIVGSTEAMSSAGTISNESPVGAALLGARVGDTVTAETPDGAILEFKVLEIQRLI